MATRGKVKDVRDNGTGITEGVVFDTVNNVDVNYEQTLGTELGLKKDMIVRMEVITKADGSQLAVSLDPVEKAKIATIDPRAGTGTLTDNAGNSISFVQNYCTELGLAVGVKVHYTLVMANGALTETSLQIVK